MVRDPQQVDDRTARRDVAGDVRADARGAAASVDPTMAAGGGGSTSASFLGSWIVLLVVSLPLAASAFAEGQKDWQYQLAGLADPFLGRPAPGFTIAIGVVLTVLVALGASLVQFLVRRTEPRDAEPARLSRFRARWWFVLLAGWGAFALGIASVAMAGGPRSYDGTMRFAFGRPISSEIEIAATCQTPVGQSDVVARVTPRGQGLFRMQVRNVATGERGPWPAPAGVFVDLMGDGSQATAFDLPNVPARPLPYIEATLGDGQKRSDPPVSFLGAYNYGVVDAVEKGMGGKAEVQGTRFAEPFGGGTGPGSVRWVNLEIPNDPWPPTITIDIEWICGP